MEQIYSLEELEARIRTGTSLLVYFSTPQCNVCKVLKPKVMELAASAFPALAACYVDTEKSPLLSGQHRVFTIPTILLFSGGKEQFRFSRNFSILELEEALRKF